MKRQQQEFGPSIPGATDIVTWDVKCGRAKDFIRNRHESLVNKGKLDPPKGWKCREKSLNRQNTKTRYTCEGPGARVIKWTREGQIG